jgi:hypothetical protein
VKWKLYPPPFKNSFKSFSRRFEIKSMVVQNAFRQNVVNLLVC